MKPGHTIAALFFLCTLFFCTGFLLYAEFYSWWLPDIDGIIYQMDLTGLVNNQETFAAVTAAMPLLLFLTWQLVPIYSSDKKTLSALIVLFCMFMAVFIRYKILVAEYSQMVESLNSNRYPVSVSFEQLGFEWYLAGGLLTGCTITYLSFHNIVIQRQKALDRE